MKSSKIYMCVTSIVLLFGAASLTANAQQPATEDPNNSINRQLMLLLKSHQQRAAATISASVDDIEHAVKLSPQQAKKLRVAGKRTGVSHAIQAVTTMEGKAKFFKLEFGPEHENEHENEHDLETPGKETKPVPVEDLKRMGHIYAGLGKPSVVKDDVLWKSTVKKNLTDQQLTAWQQWQAQRDADRQFAAVSLFIDRADEALLLSPEQKKKLFTVINDEFGESLSNKLDYIQSGIPRSRHEKVSENLVRKQVLKINTSLVDTILSESQLKLWKLGLRLELVMLEAGKPAK